jgi:hypothetical protein
MAADDNKRENCVKACFTDREFIDLGRLSARSDRKVADMVRVLVRRCMYGMVREDDEKAEGRNAD